MGQTINHILVIAPAGRVDLESLQRCIDILEKQGKKVELGENLPKVFGPFAGMDAERLADLQWALNHPEADAVWMARGGYGMTRIIDNVKLEGFYSKPKQIIGYSDITALFLDKRFEKNQLVHSPMLESATQDELAKVFELIEHDEQSFECSSIQSKLSLNGKITGGNLSLILNQMGIIENDFYKDKILFIEEIEEYDYKIDRMMVQLERSGIIKSLKALMIGSFSEIQEGRFPLENLYESIIERAKIAGIPCIFDVPTGHIHPNNPLIFNREAELNYSSGRLDIKYQS